MNAIFKCLVVGAAGLLLTACERPPVDSVQHGYRGTGMVQVYNPRTLAEQIPGNQPPEALAAAPTEGPLAKDIYQNVQVLGDLNVAQFTRHMAAIRSLPSPLSNSTLPPTPVIRLGKSRLVSLRRNSSTCS